MKGSTVRMVLIGSPGAGKGTQGRLLAEKLGIPLISTGDMLRAAVGEDSPMGREAQSFMERGELVPDGVMIALIRRRLEHGQDTARGFILDGFPRTLEQARALDTMLSELHQPLDLAIEFRVRRVELLRRLTGRWNCHACGASFNLQTASPVQVGVCDHCGGELFQRADDKVETVSRRLEVYAAQTEPIVAYYRERGALRVVDGERGIEEIQDQLAAMVGSRAKA